LGYLPGKALPRSSSSPEEAIFPKKLRIIRDGRQVEVEGKALVPGTVSLMTHAVNNQSISAF